MKTPINSSLNSYRFASEFEPTDKQLKQLMKEVAMEAKQRYTITNNRFQEELRQFCLQQRKL